MAYASAPPHMGGVETLIDEVSTRLVAGGVEVTVLTTDRSGELPRDESLSRLPHPTMAGLSPIPRLLFGPRLGAPLVDRQLRHRPCTGRKLVRPTGGAGGGAPGEDPVRADLQHRRAHVSSAKFSAPTAVAAAQASAPIGRGPRSRVRI